MPEITPRAAVDADAAENPRSYYRHLGENRYESTIHAQGAWNPHEQHMAPVTGIMTHALEQYRPREDMRLARFSFDILGLIPAGEFSIETMLLRPGKTIELLQAELIADGRVAVRATAWRLQKGNTTAVEAYEDEPLESLEAADSWDGMTKWPGGFIRSIEARVSAGHRPGRGRVWLHTPYPLLDGGAPSSALVRLLGLADSANGVSARMEPATGGWMFPNVDLSLHIYREPEGEWLGLDTQVTMAGDGIGLTSAVLNDIKGPFARSEQILTVRALPSAP